ncbi:ATP-dependent protease LonB [Desulfitobacterium dichloroeliminans LMG P-21439]|uniref:endopeptidase La n=1 Tax=Desulfitobacterium dichloroeliminans (strain LMG P-21439 / DCA1) TaxID=871963 RepID=L0FB90_DESDL|nr:ATP-dependent protease LonB [Desulfitobacterium dichloroeliminans]AGA70487.1 ATP-dependent protease LonB [Desulfitobacterium dichloroeliminans LMG P-21439]
MAGLTGIVMMVQFIFAVIIGLYFWGLLKSQQGNKVSIERESKKELEKLEKMRKIALTTPLSEKTRPAHFEEIVGQMEGIKALRAALCGPNPQHVLVYGPPGIGKTAAARLVLEEAKKNPLSPFKEEAKFIEIDGATARFDERGIADPLIGSVHDPIYQGAGAMGMAGIPQPKAGAVTKAHGGVLFIDEIGELHPIQINKLLKVLEDRKVILESSYYSSEDTNVPAHIHDIFQNGLPADFRMVGATTRSPEEIPPAIRSRCMEIFFRSLLPEEIAQIARGAAAKMEIPITMSALNVVKLYATNGREAVNIVQLAAGVAQTDKQMEINAATVEWVVTSGQYVPRPDRKVPLEAEAGLVNGLAVYGPNMGMLLELEVTANSVAPGTGELLVTGIIEEEEQRSNFKKTRRKSMARSSVENVLTVIRRQLGIFPHDYDIHVNFPGGVPIDGPSAGIAMATAVVSAIRKEKVDNYLAMTGELSIRGGVKPVGGVPAKLEAAHQAGCRRVFIPKENWQERFKNFAEGMEVIPVETLNEVLAGALLADPHKEKVVNPTPLDEILARLEINPKTNPSSVNLPDQGQSC